MKSLRNNYSTSILQRDKSSPLFSTLNNNTAELCWAIKLGNVDLVKQLILDADVNVANFDDRTALHIAVCNNEIEIVQLLVENGADLQAQDRWKMTPIDYAQQFKHEIILNILLEHERQAGDSIAFKDSARLPKAAMRIGEDAVFEAAKKGDIERVKREWLAGHDVDEIQANSGRTALHVAVEAQQRDVISLLLSAGASTELQDRDGYTPVELAEKLGFSHALDMFRSNKVILDTQIVDSNAFDAAAKGDYERLKKLLGKINVNAVDYNQRSLLHVAASEGYDDIVQLLINHGAHTHTLDRWGNSPLSDAVSHANKDCAKILREHGASEGTHPTLGSTVDRRDGTIFNEALEIILTLTSLNNWTIAEAFCPAVDEFGTTLAAHSVWHVCKSAMDSNVGAQSPRSSRRNVALANFRKAHVMMLFDPDQSAIGRAYVRQQFEWHADLCNVPQDKYFSAPYARRAKLNTLLVVPMIQNEQVVAVLCWHSTKNMVHSTVEVRRIQLIVNAISHLARLKKDLQKHTSCEMPTYQYCHALDAAITLSGELFEDNNTQQHVESHESILALALKWNLFSTVETLASSSSSESHEAAIRVLLSVARLVKIGVLANNITGSPANLTSCARTMTDLLERVLYHAQYLKRVSPPSGNSVLLDANKIIAILDKSQPVEKSPDPSSDQPECVLCKFKVPGHIHEGKLVVSASESNSVSEPVYFQPDQGLCSPIFHRIREKHVEIAESLANHEQRIDLENQTLVEYSTAIMTSRDLYDTFGTSHSLSRKRSSSLAEDKQSLLAHVNAILADTTCLLQVQDILKLHKCISLEDPNQQGQVRTTPAVGYASGKIYRSFLPAEEINAALDFMIFNLHNPPLCMAHPLVKVYYVYSVTVYDIHPFHDGNGRCARLLANILLVKLGFPNVLKSSDKTLQFTDLITKVLQTLQTKQNVKRHQHSRILVSTKDHASMWF